MPVRLLITVLFTLIVFIILGIVGVFITALGIILVQKRGSLQTV